MNFSLNLGSRTFSFGARKSAADFVRGTDVDASDSGGAKLVSPYAQSAWVYIAVSRLAEKISSIPFRISRVGTDNARRLRALRGSADPAHRNFRRRSLSEDILDSGDCVDLFNRPHPLMNRQLFWEMVVTWNCLRGEFFVVPLDASDSPVDLSQRGARVHRLLTLPTELFWHVVAGYYLTGWRYTGSPLVSPLPSEFLLPGELIHSRTPNPYQFWRGLSPLAVAMVAAGADYAASKYSQGYWLNNADTGVIVTTDQQVNEEQRIAIMAALRERKRKAGTADRPLFLWGGAKVEKPQLSGMETQFIENRKMNRQEIAAIFKVPDSVMGFSEAKASALSGGGSAIQTEQVQFVEGAIAPLACHLEAAMEAVVSSFGPDLVGWFDLDSLPVMQEARRARLDSASKAFSLGAAFNDINELYDLGFPEYDWGNKSFLPFNLQEVGSGAADELPGEDDPAAAEDAVADSFLRLAALIKAPAPAPAVAARKPDTELLWERHVGTRRRQVKLVTAKTTKILGDFRRSTLAKLDEIHLQKSAVTKGLVDLIFSHSAFGKALLTELDQPVRATLQIAADELRSEISLDDPWHFPPAKASQFLTSRTQPIMDTGQTVRNILNTSLEQGIQDGDTTAELANRVKSVFNDLSIGEAKRIAQTETNAAYNFARHETMLDVGIDYKAWLSSHGPTVRPAHEAAENFYIDSPIPVDEPFMVGGELLMYPGDPNGSPGNIINCQCIQLAARKTAEDATTATYRIYGAGEMSFTKKTS